MIYVLGQIFVENAKKTLEHFLNSSSRTKIENRENAEILVNSIKVTSWGIQNAKTQPFSEIKTEILYIFLSASSLIHTYILFSKI